MKFTDEERKIIDKLLEEGDEMQRENGNKLYTTEEVLQYLRNKFEEDMRKARKNKIYNIKSYVSSKGEKKYRYIQNKIFD